MKRYGIGKVVERRWTIFRGGGLVGRHSTAIHGTSIAALEKVL